VSDDALPSGPLWSYFREVRTAVERANRGDGDQPYQTGDFLVHAEAGDVELSVRDVSEEDAILIAGELRSLGARTAVRALGTCPACGARVPRQAYCVACRAALPED
jgi:hypothetical protein